MIFRKIKMAEKLFYRRHEVLELLGVSDSTLQRRIRAGALPPLDKFGKMGRITGYSSKTINKIKNEIL